MEQTCFIIPTNANFVENMQTLFSRVVHLEGSTLASRSNQTRKHCSAVRTPIQIKSENANLISFGKIQNCIS